MISLVAIFGTFIVALFVVDMLLAAPKYENNRSDHFNGKKFLNPHENGTHRYSEVLKWWFSGNDRGVWEKLKEDTISQFTSPQSEIRDEECQITFVNHATFLLQVDGMNLLTDPIWSYRASPYQWIGPKRMRPPGIAFDDLPAIDAVLISHNHYDHLDIRTVKRLHKQHNPQFVVPLGVEKLLHSYGITKTTHLDWWGKYGINDRISLTAVPGQHFSGRGLFDRNQTLWCGYVLHTSVGNIYFAGDTGYGEFIQEISSHFGPMFTSLLPIGAYKPRWFMESIHMSPEDAVQAHLVLQSQYSIGMHFGTFPMADDGMFEPAQDLAKARKKYQITEEEFLAPDHGKSYKPELSLSVTRSGVA
jgi:L-ascorbate metabolism protein UlaG (beta-lactamase superfamily)